MTSMPPAKMAPPIPTSYTESHAEKMKAALELSRMFASSKANSKTQGFCQSPKKGNKKKACRSTKFEQDKVDISKPIVYGIPPDVTAWLTEGSSSSTPSTPRLPISSNTTSTSDSVVSHSKVKAHDLQTSIPSGPPRNIGKVRAACKGDMIPNHGQNIGLQPGRPQEPVLQIVDVEKTQDSCNLSPERTTAAPKLKPEPDLIDVSPLPPHQSQPSSTSNYLSDLKGLSFEGITISGVSNTKEIEERESCEVKLKELSDIESDIKGLSDSTQNTEISAKPRIGLAASRWAD